jgi:hypothetical protein
MTKKVDWKTVASTNIQNKIINNDPSVYADLAQAAGLTEGSLRGYLASGKGLSTSAIHRVTELIGGQTALKNLMEKFRMRAYSNHANRAERIGSLIPLPP